MAGKSLEEFQRLHDPMFGVKSPSYKYSRDLPEFRRAIIVAAQNATPVHGKFWSCILTAAEAIGAQVFVIPTRYQNPTSQWSGSQANAEYYDPAVAKYLWNERYDFNENLRLLADIPGQPTEVNPLAGLDGISHASSCIVGHSKLQLRTVAVPQGRTPKILTTTGICTVENYTQARRSKIGAFHHSLSACLVELDGKGFHLRQLHYSKTHEAITDGAAATMYRHNGVVCKAPRPLALGMGDTHVDSIDPLVESATFKPNGMIDSLRPRNVVYADLLDMYSRNHWHEGDPFTDAGKRDTGRDDVKAEVFRAITFVKERRIKGVEYVVQASNHNDMLRRWILKADWKKDPQNSDFYLETALHLRRNLHVTRKGVTYPDPFKWWVDKAKMAHVRVLDIDESFSLADVEMGMHGDIGPNGSRGSRKNLSRIGTKSIIFHSHSPGIEEGCYQAGTSTLLRLEYNHGPSSWLNSHVLLQHDGKRQLLNIIDGAYKI